MKKILSALAMALSLTVGAQDMELHLNNGQTVTYGLQTVDRLMHNNGNLEVYVQGQSPVVYLLTDIAYFNYQAATVTNVSTVSSKSAIRLYPNPGKNLFTLDLVGSEAAELEVYDLQGKLLHQEIIAEGSQRHSLELNGFSSGLYVVKVRQGKDEYVEKLRIQK